MADNLWICSPWLQPKTVTVSISHTLRVGGSCTVMLVGPCSYKAWIASCWEVQSWKSRSRICATWHQVV